MKTVTWLRGALISQNTPTNYAAEIQIKETMSECTKHYIGCRLRLKDLYVDIYYFLCTVIIIHIFIIARKITLSF